MSAPASPLFDELPELVTPRLVLRKLGQGDLEALHEQNSDGEIARYMGWRATTSVEESREYLDDALERYDRHYPAPWGIALRRTGTLIGRCGFETWHLSDARAEISFALARRYWGNGYMREALAAMFAYGFDRVGLNRIEGRCDRRNERSAAVMRLSGMSLEGIHRQQRYSDGLFHDMMSFAILREEWASKGFIM
jgi:[ribosomal protein S5]-alanine N-acetyltransferase